MWISCWRAITKTSNCNQHQRHYIWSTGYTMYFTVLLTVLGAMIVWWILYTISQIIDFFFNFNVRLLSVLRGHSVFSSPPQQPLTSDFEGFSIPDFIHYIYFPILILEQVLSNEGKVSCWRKQQEALMDLELTTDRHSSITSQTRYPLRHIEYLTLHLMSCCRSKKCPYREVPYKPAKVYQIK